MRVLIDEAKENISHLKDWYLYIFDLNEKEKVVEYEMAGVKGVRFDREPGGNPSNDAFYRWSERLTQIERERQRCYKRIEETEKLIRIILEKNEEENLKQILDEIVIGYKYGNLEKKMTGADLVVLVVYEGITYRKMSQDLKISSSVIAKEIDETIEEAVRKKRGF